MGVPKEIEIPNRNNFSTCRDYAEAVMNTIDEMESEIYKALPQMTRLRTELIAKAIDELRKKLPTFNYNVINIASQYLLLPEVTQSPLKMPKILYTGTTRTYSYCLKDPNTGDLICNNYDLIPVPELTFDPETFNNMLEKIKSGISDINIRSYLYQEVTLIEGGEVCNARKCYRFATELLTSYIGTTDYLVLPCPGHTVAMCNLVTVLGNPNAVGIYQIVPTNAPIVWEMWSDINRKFGTWLVMGSFKLTLQKKIPEDAELPNDIVSDVVILLPGYVYVTTSDETENYIVVPYSRDEYKGNIFFGNIVLPFATGVIWGSLPHHRLVPFVFEVGTDAYTIDELPDVLRRFTNIKPLASLIEGMYQRIITEQIPIIPP